MISFVAPSEHQVLVFLIQITVLLVSARVLGQLFRRVGQPSVVGELLAGVLLGPSVLGAAAPGAFDWLFPGGLVQSAMLFTVGWVGVMLLLVVTGFETDLTLISRLGRAVVWVTAGSLLVPFAFGLLGGYWAPEFMLGDGVDRTLFALFLATALTISSLPVIAKILSELRLLRRNFGQMTLAVAMANDVIGWILLGLIAGLATAGALDLASLARTLVGLVVFLGIAAAVGQRIVDGVLQTLRRLQVGVGGWVTMAVVMSLGLGAITQGLGVEAVLGAFIAGILLGRSRYARHDVQEQLETFTVSILAPIFFATAGLRVDLSLLSDARVLLWTAIVVVLATASKFIGSMIGARIAGLERREGMALGTALNARGALEIVIATVGLSLGVLNETSYAIVVVMAIVTSLMAPPMLRALVSGWAGSPEEQARLRREELMSRNVLIKPGQVLVPTRGGVASRWVSALVHQAFPPETRISLLEVIDATEPAGGAIEVMLDTFDDRRVERLRTSGDPSETVTSQSLLGFDVVAAGLSPTSGSAGLGPITSAALMSSHLPVILVRPPLTASSTPSEPAPVHRVLLPVSAARQSRAAAELALGLAAEVGAEVILLHVTPAPDDGGVRRLLRTTLRSHERIVGSYADPVGERLIGQVERSAREAGVAVRRVFMTHHSRSTAISTAVVEHACDLVVLGIETQDADGTPFLGQTAERVLDTCRGAVAIVALPPT
jgi:Kef-type K+ transport system membrane component KefB